MTRRQTRCLPPAGLRPADSLQASVLASLRAAAEGVPRRLLPRGSEVAGPGWLTARAQRERCKRLDAPCDLAPVDDAHVYGTALVRSPPGPGSRPACVRSAHPARQPGQCELRAAGGWHAGCAREGCGRPLCRAQEAHLRQARASRAACGARRHSGRAGGLANRSPPCGTASQLPIRLLNFCHRDASLISARSCSRRG